jgi:hypothetical protein
MAQSDMDIESVVLQSSDNPAGEADGVMSFKNRQHSRGGSPFEAFQKVKAQRKPNAVGHRVYVKREDTPNPHFSGFKRQREQAAKEFLDVDMRKRVRHLYGSAPHSDLCPLCLALAFAASYTCTAERNWSL